MVESRNCAKCVIIRAINVSLLWAIREPVNHGGGPYSPPAIKSRKKIGLQLKLVRSKLIEMHECGVKNIYLRCHNDVTVTSWIWRRHPKSVKIGYFQYRLTTDSFYFDVLFQKTGWWYRGLKISWCQHSCHTDRRWRPVTSQCRMSDFFAWTDRSRSNYWPCLKIIG